MCNVGLDADALEPLNTFRPIVTPFVAHELTHQCIK